MEVSTPLDPVYYYECSGGSFRLSYFVPPGTLQRLVQRGKANEVVLEDFPDGVDLDCTKPDFDSFEELYGFRPKHDPDALRAAFFAMYSATRDWEHFRGTGIVPRKDLESLLKPVVEALEDNDAMPLAAAPAPAGEVSLRARQRDKSRRARQHARMSETLEQMPVSGIDARKDLRQQKFTYRKSKGRPAAEVFDALHTRQKEG